MHLLVPLAALFGIEVEAITHKIRNTIIINAVMIGLALVGAVFLVVAGFLALAELYGAIYAALIMAAVFLVLALLRHDRRLDRPADGAQVAYGPRPCPARRRYRRLLHGAQ